MDFGFVEIISSKVSSPIVTIAIPTYKRPEMLEDALRSAIEQAFDEEYEIIVVDNNPERNDGTELLLKKYSSVSFIAYYKNTENVGMIGNWNRLYELAKGRYVAMLHDDDILYNNYLSITFSLIKRTNFKYSFIYPYLFYSKERNLSNDQEVKLITYRIYKAQDFVVSPNGIPSGVVLKRELFFKYGPYTMEYYPISDMEFNFRFLKHVKGCRITYPHTILYYMGGQNESCKLETTKKFFSSFDTFYDSLRHNVIFPWSFFSIFTKRDLMNGMMWWWSNFSSREDIMESVSEINWKSNKMKDYLSSKMKCVLAYYLRLVRSKTIYIGK